MTIKTLAAVVGTLAIIVGLFFITKITTPSRLVAKSGFFAGSTADDWGRGQALLVSGNLPGWRAAKSRCLSKQFDFAGRADASRESRAEAEAREGASMTPKDFAFRIDRWTDDGERIVEHVAGAKDFRRVATTRRPQALALRGNDTGTTRGCQLKTPASANWHPCVAAAWSLPSWATARAAGRSPSRSDERTSDGARSADRLEARWPLFRVAVGTSYFG